MPGCRTSIGQVNPRRLVVEDRVLTLADALAAAGLVLAAARLREVVPESYGLGDEHLPLLKDRLRDVSTPDLVASAQRILAALDDLPTVIGVRGTVRATWHPDGFLAHWEEEDWLEGAPRGLDLDAVLAWAGRRADRILLVPEDGNLCYSAGRLRDPAHPQLER